MESKFIRVLVILGVPCAALGVSYLLFRQFNFQFQVINSLWSAVIVILFLMIVFGITFYSIQRWSTANTERFKTNILAPSSLGISDNIANLLGGNFAGHILDEITFWESEGLSKTDVLQKTIAEIQDRYGKLEAIASREGKSSKVNRSITEQMQLASTLAKINYQKLMEKIQKHRSWGKTDAEILANLVDDLHQMKQIGISASKITRKS